MSNLANDFMNFLFEKHKLTGQNSFDFLEYQNFDGYEDAIIELVNLGIITRIPDILGTIQVNVPQKQKAE